MAKTRGRDGKWHKDPDEEQMEKDVSETIDESGEEYRAKIASLNLNTKTKLGSGKTVMLNVNGLQVEREIKELKK